MRWMSLQEVETGTIVLVTHAQSGLSFRALVEKKNDASSAQLSFCRIERPYEKLRVALNGQVSWAIAASKFATFLIEDATQEEDAAVHEQAGNAAACADGWLVRFCSIVNQKKANRENGIGWHLGVALQDNGAATSTDLLSHLIGDAARGEGSLFRVAVVSARGAFALDTSRMVLEGSFASNRHSSMLSASQLQSFMQNGYLAIRDVVPLRLVNAARRRINHELGIPGRMIDGGVEGTAKLAGNVSNSEDVLNLFYLSDACKYVEALVGAGKVASPQGAQIAMRFPELGEPREPLGTEWHTDGMRQGKLHPFTLLLGIALSDVREPLAGNFTVFPESHRTLQSLLIENGKLEGYDDECYKADSVWGDGTLPDLGTPVQLLASRGDIVLAHPNLAHRGGLNFSPDIRYQVYFRMKHVEHATLQAEARTNLWADLEGLRHLDA
ncbi:Protein involved in biosynthesis of mitomycin antibiotics/polyketide fumonisin, partial [Globisporangium splendens]